MNGFKGRLDPLDIQLCALGLKEHLDVPTDAQVVPVQDGNKWRLVTIHSEMQAVLRPLHNTLYDHLSLKPWLLRGDARPGRFKDFTQTSGEVFVSGDYEAATDNIALDVYITAMNSVRDTCSHVPRNVWDIAQDQARHTLVGGGETGVQQRGQLMGSYLSFPFLCLINFLAFKFSVRRHVPLRINGDDIVFRATQEECDRWKENVGRCGLTLSQGKTMVDTKYFSLNSCLFRAGMDRTYSVPFVRAKALVTKPDSLQSLAGQFSALCVGAAGFRRRALQVDFLKRNGKLIWSSQRPVSDFLPSVSSVVLRLAGLSKRESYYLGLPKPPPLPPPPTRSMWSAQGLVGLRNVPISGMSFKERRDARSHQRDVIQPALALVSRLCLMRPSGGKQEYWESVRNGTWKYRPPSLSGGLLLLFNRLTRAMRCSGAGLHLPPPRGETVAVVYTPAKGRKRGLGSVW